MAVRIAASDDNLGDSKLSLFETSMEQRCDTNTVLGNDFDINLPDSDKSWLCWEVLPSSFSDSASHGKRVTCI